MKDEKFRNETVTITREELAEIFGVKIARLIKRFEQDEDRDEELNSLIVSMITAFSGDVLTTVFDEGKIGDLEIDTEEN